MTRVGLRRRRAHHEVDKADGEKGLGMKSVEGAGSLWLGWDGDGALRRRKDVRDASVLLLFPSGEEVVAHGKFTAHDHYMGYPWSTQLDRLIRLLRDHEVPYRVQGGGLEDPFVVDEQRWLRSASVCFSHSDFKRLRATVIR